ncbi:SH3 domain-binding glutamic acid-rich protein homolog isoform X3 [Drosophila virilis]|uniref:SH3 domain-binding glutamic acid-rich protein homolog isoform X3 n=1 Tax=Drosophila virilis TaxID=7244 RepID=UPI0013962CC9|nr:SH3 domain-binding glutamic acid-rich protein homolog isoform X3 [Drosophila virilis]
MVLKVYVSGMSGNKEVKKRQQRVLMILDSKNIQYDTVDITEPGKEGEKELMQNKSTSNGGTVSDPEPRHPLPPQIFNDDEYCGDYDAFDMANEIDTLEVFLKLAPADTTAVSSAQIELKQENGVAKEEEKKAPAEGETEAAAEADADAAGAAEETDEADKKKENPELKTAAKRTTVAPVPARVPIGTGAGTSSTSAQLLDSEREAAAQ